MPSTPAADPLYDIEDHDFSETPSDPESEPDPGVPHYGATARSASSFTTPAAEAEDRLPEI